MSEIVLQEEQKLIEQWTVEFTGKNRIHRKADEWVECRVVKMYHGTIYGGANGTGKTVEEARLNAVLGLARAICDDGTAFQHDADEIFKGEQLRWWQGKIQEERDELEALEGEYDQPSKGARQVKKIKRRIKLLEQLQAEWQEEHDYWPEETSEDLGSTEKDFLSASRAAAASAQEAARGATGTHGSRGV